METPTRLKKIKAELFKREAKKAEKFWSDAAVEVQTALRASLASLVSHMIERLSPAVDGKRKRFHESTLKRMEQFLDLFQARNITDDAATAKLVTKAKEALKGTDVTLLRDDNDLRERVVKAFKEIDAQLDTMIVDRPKRKIILDEEETKNET